MAPAAAPPRELLFVTHAAPEDNEFALWLSSKLAMAGYRVWIDRRRLRGGADFWDEIERVLRNDALKQIVVFTENVRKDGVKKELAIGDTVRKKIPDPKFMIPVRSSGIDFGEAPPEFLRDQIIDAHPNWHDCLKELFQTLEEAGVPKSPSPDSPPSASTNFVSLWQLNLSALVVERFFVAARLRADAVAVCSNSNSYQSGNSPP